jgi:predicted nucleic acid-binding protein
VRVVTSGERSGRRRERGDQMVIGELDSAQAVTLLRHPIAAPDLLAPECANIRWKKVARRELRTAEAEAIALALESAGIELYPTRPSATSTACALGHAAYDCCYLALAEQLRQPLVTADLRLVNAVRADNAKRFGHLVVPLSELGAE